jgi:hypothetical protein
MSFYAALNADYAAQAGNKDAKWLRPYRLYRLYRWFMPA